MSLKRASNKRSSVEMKHTTSYMSNTYGPCRNRNRRYVSSVSYKPLVIESLHFDLVPKDQVSPSDYLRVQVDAPRVPNFSFWEKYPSQSGLDSIESGWDNV